MVSRGGRDATTAADLFTMSKSLMESVTNAVSSALRSSPIAPPFESYRQAMREPPRVADATVRSYHDRLPLDCAVGLADTLDSDIGPVRWPNVDQQYVILSRLDEFAKLRLQLDPPEP